MNSAFNRNCGNSEVVLSFINAMRQVGLFLLIMAGIFAIVGLMLMLIPSMPRLPGDIVVKRRNITIFLPLGTSLLLSIVLTIVLNLLIRLFKK